MKQILVVADLHVGSNNAPMSDNVEIKDSLSGQIFKYRPSDLQKYMFDRFAQMAYGVKWDYVIVNGDLCAGWNKGDEGRFVWSADLAYQAEAATQILSKIDCDKMFFTMGTPYHSESDRPLEQIVAEKIASRGNTATEFAYDFLFDIEGWTVHVGHCMDWKGSVTESLARELGTRGADLVIRSHRHEFAYMERGRKKGVSTPCWEFRTPFGITNGMYSATDIGMTAINITEDEIDVATELVDMSRNLSPRIIE